MTILFIESVHLSIFRELQRRRLISQHMIVCQCVHDQGECYRLLTEEADECCISCETQQRQSQYHNTLKGCKDVYLR